MFGFLRKREPAVVTGEVPSRLPDDLTLAIENAHVSFRGEPDPETGEIRILIRLAGVGAFRFDGLEDAAERIERGWDVAPAMAQRAAKLLAAVIAREERELVRAYRQAGRHRSWVWDY
jgi:hypothetical protein